MRIAKLLQPFSLQEESSKRAAQCASTPASLLSRLLQLGLRAFGRPPQASRAPARPFPPLPAGATLWQRVLGRRRLRAPSSLRCRSLTRSTLMLSPNTGMMEDGHTSLEQQGSEVADEFMSKLSFIYPAVRWHISLAAAGAAGPPLRAAFCTGTRHHRACSRP